MSYLVAIDPQLMSAADFIDSWNEDDECAKMARAETAKSDKFSPESLAIAFLVSVASSLTTAAIIALAEKLFSRKGMTASVELIETRNPDGSQTLVIRKKLEID